MRIIVYGKLEHPHQGQGLRITATAVSQPNLTGDYPNYTNSNFISPKFVVPSVEENPRLRFWHYFSTPEIHDSGVVKIYGEDSVWTNISPHYYRQSGVWTYALLDLREYAGQEVKIAFYFYSNATYTATGWYIDDILVEDRSL